MTMIFKYEIYNLSKITVLLVLNDGLMCNGKKDLMILLNFNLLHVSQQILFVDTHSTQLSSSSSPYIDIKHPSAYAGIDSHTK